MPLRLLEGIVSDTELDQIDADILAETEAAAKRARQAPFPAAEHLFENVW